MREWLDNWKGLGQVATGIARKDYDLELTRYDPLILRGPR